MLRQNMNASNQEAANWLKSLWSKINPSTASTPPTTIKIVGTLRHLDKSSGCSLAGLVLISLFQIGALIRRKIIHRSEVAQLQGAQVGDDGPAVFRRHIRAVSAHRIAAVRNHPKNFAVSVFHNARVLQICHGGHQAQLLGDAVAVRLAA